MCGEEGEKGWTKVGREESRDGKKDVRAERDFQNAPVPLTISRLKKKNKPGLLDRGGPRGDREFKGWRISYSTFPVTAPPPSPR